MPAPFEKPDDAGPGPPRPPDHLGETFPRELRLRRPAEFQRVLSKGWRWTTRHLVVHVLVNDRQASRLGLTVSRKVGDAVRRNRVKRRLRESFRRCIRASIGAVHVDLVLRALPGAADASQASLQAEVLTAIEAWQLGKSRPARPRSRRPENTNP